MKKILAAAAAAVLCQSAFAADVVSVTTGAGYIPMVKAVVQACRAADSTLVIENYGGNIGQMLAQIEQGSGVNVVISDKNTLNGIKTGVKFATYQPLGSTPLVLIWRKGVTVTSASDLSTDAVKSIASPDPRAAIYGRAARGWATNLPKAERDAVNMKWMQLGNVPQVVSYVARGEVDAGFVNLAAAKKNADKLGGSLQLKDGYPAIEMVAAVVDGEQNNKAVQSFLKCLERPAVKADLKRFGVMPQ